MKELPPEDQPDVIYIGPVGPIPIGYDDDPRYEEERAAWSEATKKAQALHSAEELLAGLRDPDWRVRFESVDRLVARWKDDPRTADTVLKAASEDSSSAVRANAMMRLDEFDPEQARRVLLSGLEDPDEDVRWAAQFILDQLGPAP